MNKKDKHFSDRRTGYRSSDKDEKAPHHGDRRRTPHHNPRENKFQEVKVMDSKPHDYPPRNASAPGSRQRDPKFQDHPFRSQTTLYRRDQECVDGGWSTGDHVHSNHTKLPQHHTKRGPTHRDPRRLDHSNEDSIQQSQTSGFPCKICHKQFSSSNGLAIHTGKVHKGTQQSSHNYQSTPVSSAPEKRPSYRSHQTCPPKMNSESQAKRFSCDLCDKVYNSERKLTEHFESLHVDNSQEWQLSFQQKDDGAFLKHYPDTVRSPNYSKKDSTAASNKRDSDSKRASMYHESSDNNKAETRCHRALECFHCEECFASELLLGIHIGKEHQDDVTRDIESSNAARFSIFDRKSLDKSEIDFKLSKDEVHDASKAVNSFINAFENELKDSHTIKFNVLRSGSYYDNTKIFSPDEFDFMFYPKGLAADAVFSADSPPGYCMVKVRQPIPKEYESMVTNGYLNPERFKREIFTVFRQCVGSSSFRPGRRTEIKERPDESPAFTVLYRAFPGKEPIDIDLVPSIRFAGWPEVARKLKPHWIKRDRTLEAMKEYYVVMKTYPLEVRNRALLWRVSFSASEKILILYANNGDRNSPRKYIFKMLKWLMHNIKKEYPDQIQKFCSYHLKMFMLNEYDVWGTGEFQVENKQVLLRKTLQRLLLFLRGDFPKIINYFIRTDNVIKFVPNHERQIICRKLDSYLK